MGFLPSRMSRLLVGGHKSRMEGVIEALHQEGIVHIEDYRDPTGITAIGTPLEAGDEASALLVRTRGLQKSLGTEGFAPVGVIDNAANLLAEAEAATAPSLEELRRIREAIAKADADAAALAPVVDLDIDLGATTGLRSVKVLVGTTRSDPTAAVQRTGAAHEMQVAPSGSGYAVAVVVGAASAAAVEKAMAESGFSALLLPSGTGTPRQRISALATEGEKLQSQLVVAEGDADDLRATWGARLAGLEHVLAEQVEKTQAPLKFGVTETTFHIEGWVPVGRVRAVEEALKARFGDNVYFHELGDAPSAPHAHEEAAGHPVSHATDSNDHGQHGHGVGQHVVNAVEKMAMAQSGAGMTAVNQVLDEEHGHHVGPEDEPPVHLANPKLARPYEFLLGLLGKPRYHELDPTKLMLLFFPLFFGLMVGDVVVGLVIMIFGLWLKKNKLFGIGGPSVGRALFAGGLLSVIIGAFVFGEALGIHFVTPPGTAEHAADMSWESVLGLHIPYANEPHGLLYKSGTLEQAMAAAEHEGGGITLASHTPQHLMLGPVMLGYYSKIHDVAALLIWAILIGFVHLVLGFVLGVRNVYVAHGATLAIQEKAAWLMLIAGGIVAYVGFTFHDAIGVSTAGWLVAGAGLGIVAASIVLLYMGAAKVIGAGWIAFLEIPSLMGNLLSYTRLAAIGASKAGMVIAISAIAFTIMGGGIGGWIVYLIGFACIIPLAILGAGLQSLRLQFVEFFQKFYTGGGRPYLPFGRRAA